MKVCSPLEFNIYGPQHDLVYWKKCLQLINKLPPNIKVTINSDVENAKVQDVFKQHDLFVFPTKGENYGHVIFESMQANTPVLTSDQTPWCSDSRGGLQTLSLNKKDDWTKTIENWAKFNDTTLLQKRSEAFNYISKFENNDLILEKYKKILCSLTILN